MELRNLSGLRFGRLSVLTQAPSVVFSSGKTGVCWHCVCDCGRTLIVRASNLIRGNKSCGCENAEIISAARKTHGMSATRIYRIWKQMRKRCNNPDDPNYPKYGGRGICVSESWNRFENFFRDMGQPPSARHSIDRIENDGHYECGNCRWATAREQCRNKSNNRFLTIDGVTRCLSEWASVGGNDPSLISYRIKRGKSLKEAVFAQ